jgi:protein arginine kinase activator
MRCDYCGEDDAIVHLTQLHDGEMKNLHLCKSCAGKNGINLEDPVSLADLLMKAGQVPADEQPVADEAKCPQCHMRLSDFKKTSRLGCPACYVSFADELAPLLMGLHKSQCHAGKAPSSVRHEREFLDRAEQVSSRLRSAIAAEQFEEAARLRDELKQLRGEDIQP